MRPFIAALAAVLVVSGCANKKTTDIDVEDASQAFKVKFGTVLDSRPVSIRSEESASVAGGAMLGGAAGALLSKTNGATLAGLVIGSLGGWGVHALFETDNGVEYTIALADGDTVVIAQLQGGGERVFRSGDSVMVQYGSTSNRVLSAEGLPVSVPRPRQVKVAGATGAKIKVKTCDKANLARATRDSCTEH